MADETINEQPTEETNTSAEPVSADATPTVEGVEGITDEDLSSFDFSSMPIPPADFSFLVYSLTTQAQIQLGMLRMDESTPAKPNLPIARHTIDLLAMLQTKTQGNLTLQERLLLENTLTDLRFRFVQASEESKKG